MEQIAHRCEAWLARQGVDEDEPDPDDAQALLIAASVEGRAGVGPRAGQVARKAGAAGSGPERSRGRGVSYEGYGLHAGTWVAANDREGLARLARYLLRPPLAKGRLEELPDGQVRWHLRKPWSDGTTAFVFSASEFVQRLAAFVVRPRVHTIHFHGVFAPHAAWRSEVVIDPAEARKHREELAASAPRRAWSAASADRIVAAGSGRPTAPGLRFWSAFSARAAFGARSAGSRCASGPW